MRRRASAGPPRPRGLLPPRPAHRRAQLGQAQPDEAAHLRRGHREDELRRYRSAIRELVTRRPADLAEVPLIGPILGQVRVPVLPDDTPASLAERVKTAEHRLYPRVLHAVCDTFD